MAAYSAVIWDMDGVLIDSERYWSDEDVFFLKQQLPDWDSVDESLFVGRSIDDVFIILRDRYDLSLDYQEYREQYDKIAKRVYGEKAELMPFAKEVLKILAGENLRQVLVSSAPKNWIGYGLSRFEIIRFFERIVSADDVDGKGKPAPEIYLHALELTKISPEMAIAVEDSEVGIRSAQNAGLTVIGYASPGNEADLSEANLIVSDLRKIPDIVERGF